MGEYIMTLDEGTTSARCIIYDRSGKAISVGQKEFRQIFPHDGWVEHDAMEIYSTQMAVAQEALLKASLTYRDIDSIGITNQRETTVVWDKKTGRPIYNAIVWQCRRTAETAEWLRDHGYSELIREKTGLIIDAYFSATKLKWILDNVEGARERAERGELLFGTVETWLIWKMTGGAGHLTDYSNAARTMMFNINTLDWDDDILAILDIPRTMLPKPVPCAGDFGETIPELFGGRLQITGAAGDQQAALFGEACFEEGEIKSTYGTGNFLLLNTGNKPVYSSSGLLTTIAWGLNGEVKYALEGSVFICGAAIQWLRDNLQIIRKSSISESLASKVSDSDGVVVVPAFTGLGAPYWEPDARGAILGIKRSTKKEHVVRATLESIAFQSDDLIKAMEQDLGRKITDLKVDGGASLNNFLMQNQADISDVHIIRHKSIESTSLGASYLAGLASGYYKSIDEIIKLKDQDIDKGFMPVIDEDERIMAKARWHRAVDAVLALAEDECF
ncbi:glycerol kinase GlpK [Mogibacterium timidum]|uniref:glycerol kinase GlpK n=1 Tax=Mogibacterium timidum TaxID=35519 RepID=UPI0023563292|nr:glycerol kinase GlpK [Mogibacterium timidum]